MKNLPIGVSTFESIITSNALYVDKTEHIYKLLKPNGRYFLSRPRRFGKSLTCSTLDAIFSGNKELFKDLWIGKESDYTWEKRPVIYIDFSEMSYDTPQDLQQSLHEELDRIANTHGVIIESTLLKTKLKNLIIKLYEKLGPVVVLIDEYDKPIIEHVDNLELADKMRTTLRGLYGAFKGKSLDKHIFLLFVTGVSKFAKVSLFSEVNNLNDITLDEDFAAMVGYTEQEVKTNFIEHITALAEKEQNTYGQTLEKIKTWYNGFRFTKSKITVYNPFSLHKCLYAKDFSNYWFVTGTPDFLVKFIKKNPLLAAEIEDIDGAFFADSNLESFTLDLYYQNYRTLLLQTGYLTFASDYDAGKCGYRVAYPNEEIRRSMTEQIMQFIGGLTPEQFGEFGDRFKKALAADDIELFCKHLQDFIKLIPHNIRVKLEKFYHQVSFMLCVLYGKRSPTEVMVEVNTETGFMDLLLEGTKYTFVVEFKRNKTPEYALEQIEHKRYWEKYEILGDKKIMLVGINFKEVTKSDVMEVFVELVTKACP